MSNLFDWDDANVAHIALHGVLPEEAEEVIVNSPLDLGYETRNDEIRLRQVGETVQGRILAVVSTLRDGRTRVVTAYTASRWLRASYLEFKDLVKDGEENTS
jgi:uncharacterized DUF497 family protein